MIEFNKHHYSDLWERREFYNNKLGTPRDPYDHYLNMLGHIMAQCNPAVTKFPHSIEVKQELIKVIMLAQAEAVKNKLDVSSLKPPKVKVGFFKKLFRIKK